MSDAPRTALGSAHERFLSSLPDRGRELRELVRKLQSAPGDERMVEQIGRRLHALYASAQVFQEQSLLSAIRVSLGGMETARLERRPPTPDELDATLGLCGFLGNGRGEGGSEPAGRAASGSLYDLDPPSEHPISIPLTVAGTLPAPEVIAVMLVAGPEVDRAVREVLPEERCELTSSGDAETALAVIDAVAPDVVVLDTSRIGGQPAELVRKLRGTRAGAVRAVVAVVPEHASDVEALLGRAHVDGVMRLPLPRTGMLERLLRWSGRGARPPGGLDTLSSGTVDEIARGVAEEIRRGIAGSLRFGRGERIELGDKSELLAAAWSAVSRVREHLAGRADGRVRFEEAPFAGGPAALALTDHEAAEPYLGLSDALRGKRMLVADDDPAVLWFFAGLLREAGAIVIEARNGREALEHARRKTPDVVISDILMPEIDGFTLCRELRRDLILAHSPVILLSWKEDFLQRMRELDAGASGYLRKEAGSHQILATVAEVLRPRTELAGLIAAGGEVSGRIEPLGVPMLLQTVAALRPDVRVAVHDAWNLFDVDIRGASTLAVTRTASDGSFARGAPALRQLLGVDSGRFTVELVSGRARGLLAQPLGESIADGLRQLAAVLDSVADGRLIRVARVALDDEVLSALLTATPTGLADVAARLRAGEAVRDLIASGAVTSRDLEQHLRELARRGAVLGVFGAAGEDLVEAARNARDREPGALLHEVERRRTSPLPMLLAESDVEWVEAPPTSPDAVPSDALAAAIGESVLASSGGADAAAATAAPEALPAPESRERVGTPPYPALESQSQPEPAVAAAPVPSVAPAPPSAEQTETDSSPPGEPRQRRHAVALGQALAAESGKAEPFTVRSQLLHGDAQSRPSQAGPRAAGEERDGEWLKLALVLAVLMLVGFVGFRVLQAGAPREDARARVARVRVPAPSLPAPDSAPGTGGAMSGGGIAPALRGGAMSGGEVAPASQSGATPQTAPPETASGFGRVLPFIDRRRGVNVADDQGLLVVEYEGAGAPPRVRAAGRELGAAPIAAALPAGRHEIVLKRDEQTSFRYVVIRAGETRIVEIRD